MIINPIWFYLINLSDTLKTVLSVGAAVLGAAAFFIFAIFPETDYYEENEEKYIKGFKFCLKIALIFLVVAIVLPSQETCYQMLIVSQATTENISTLTDTVKNCVDYIVNALK